jgi:hypothetical protein
MAHLGSKHGIGGLNVCFDREEHSFEGILEPIPGSKVDWGMG